MHWLRGCSRNSALIFWGIDWSTGVQISYFEHNCTHRWKINGNENVINVWVKTCTVALKIALNNQFFKLGVFTRSTTCCSFMLILHLCIQSRNTRRIRFAQQQLVRAEKKEKKLPAGLQNQLAIFHWWSFPNAVPKMFCSWQLIPLFTFTLTFLLFVLSQFMQKSDVVVFTIKDMTDWTCCCLHLFQPEHTRFIH